MPINQRGFTLIELIVAITIVAVLSTIGFTVYTQTQKAARDGKRIGDLEEVQKALEQYYSSTGSYPKTTDTSSGKGSASSNLSLINSSTYFRSGNLPADPSQTGSDDYQYAWCINPKKYTLCAKLESCSGKCNAADVPVDGCTAVTSGLVWYCIQSVSN